MAGVAPRMIEVGASCNNNCICCCQYNLRKYPDKTTEEIKQELDLAKHDKTTKVSFLGGEFTIRTDALELIGYAKELGFEYIHFTTNGRMLAYEKFTQAILSAGLTAVNFTFYGHDADTHDKITRTEGSFEQLLKGVKNFSKLSDRKIASITVLKENFQLLPQMLQLLEELGFDKVQLNGSIPIGMAYDNFSQVMPRYSALTPFLNDFSTMCARLGWSLQIANIPPCTLKEHIDKIDEIVSKPITVIDWDGKLVTEAMKRLSMKKKMPTCQHCSLVSVCEGVFGEYVKRFGTKEFIPLKNV